jgi:hypothetical protein
VEKRASSRDGKASSIVRYTSDTQKKNPQPEPWVQSKLNVSYFAIAACVFCNNRRACEIKSTTSNGFTSDATPLLCK